ncbi:AAA family ATPase [Microlunatus sp. GCM10028923]|uniref:helix-turn-helix transcriptional regulator n=1 Tax=Microlunatus sp. GCM10028923 TaxID=3273400 RepID=UPI00360B57A5
MVGRSRERAQLDRLLDEARAGRGGSLVLRGEAGIGKSFLLRYAESAPESTALRVLRTAGTVPEAELGYAGLHRLLRPLLELITLLPAPQQDALRTVLGLRDGPSPDRFLVGLGVLTLLSEATSDPARRGPLLCVIDDAHWLDGATREALGFVARRIESEPIAMIFAERAESGDDALAGLPVLPLSGLDRTAATELLESRTAAEPVAWSGAERDAVVRATGGNPLALTQLPLADLPRIRAGEPVPLGEELQRSFLDRLHRCSDQDRTVLLLVAAAGSIPAAVLAEAADRLGVPVDRAGLEDLIRDVDGELTCRHPLIRSACYGDADPGRLRAVHAALADAYATAPGAAAADRRAWHLGRSVTGVHADAAQELERAGAAALHRAGPGTAQALLLRAADLSPDDDSRDRRLIAAADAAVQLGDHERAIEVLARTRLGDPIETARLRGLIELRRGQPADALDLLEPVLDPGLAAEALARDPDRVVRLLMVYGEAAFQANRAEPYARLAAELERLPLDDLTGPPGVLLRMLRGSCRARTGAPPGLHPDDLDRLADLDDPYRLCWAGGLLWGLGDPGAGRRLRRAAMQRARELGAAGALAWVLDFVVVDEVGDCRYDLAEAYAEEGRRFAEETGQPTTACRHLAWLALLASLRGREADATALADAALGAAERHRMAGPAAVARRALGLLHLAAGRPADALRQLSALDRGDAGHPGIRVFSFADLVEAAVRAGEPDRARATYQRFTTWIEAGAAPELRALGTRGRALLSDGEPALAAYREALAQHAEGGQPFEEARTRLLYGEQLRRDRRPSDARAELRAAADAFRRLGATGWAERAGTELRAAGGSSPTTGDTDPAPALDGLSPQELRIAIGVGGGLTNREIAAQLFLSPRTVDYHLRKVFQKLKISSRAELIKLT